MYKQLLLVTIYVLLMFSVKGQDFKFGKISKEELQEKAYSKDSAATAAVLYRKIMISYEYNQTSNFQIVTNVHERIKIYTKDGFDYATVSEKLYKSKGTKEFFSGLKAYTYTLENNKIVKSKLKSSEIFSKELSKYYNEEKFTMPNLKEGSIIEFQYRLISPFTYSIDEIELQYDIPIKKQEVTVSIPEFYSFKTNIKGYMAVVPKQYTSAKKITFTDRDTGPVNTTFSQNSIDYRVNVSEYKMVDVPALKEEPYVNNMNNYRSSVNYEIQYVDFPNSVRKSYATTWDKVVKTIYDSENFGGQLNITRYYKDDLTALLAGKTSDVEKAAAIFSFVQARMNWNKYIGKYADEGVKKAYEKKSGSVADINLMLVAMLKKAGLKANPVLVSTRDNGVPLFPTREGFNYVLATVELNGENILLDACNKYTEPNLLPTKALNWSGRIVEEDGSSSLISVTPKKLSKKITAMKVTLKENGDVEGKERQTYTFYNAYLFRNNNNNRDEDDYLEKKENALNGIEISNYEVKNKKTLGKPIVETYDFVFENQSEVIGDKIYFSPLFFHSKVENPFKLDSRDYPIDFVFPQEEKYMVNITIPEGYEVISMPESVSLSLPNQLGSFTYALNKVGNKIQLSTNIKLNQAIVPIGRYYEIKELYKNIVEKETEKVVLSKI